MTFLQDVVPQVTSLPHIFTVYILESYYLCYSVNERGTEDTIKLLQINFKVTFTAMVESAS